MATLQTLFGTILNMSLTATYVLFAVLVIRDLLSRAPRIFSYVLWAAVLFRLLCPVSFSAPISFLSMIGKEAEPDVQIFQYLPSTFTTVRVQDGFPIFGERLPAEPEAVPTGGREPPEATAPSFWEEHGQDLLALIWAAVATALLLANAGREFRLRRRLRTAVRLSQDVFESDRVDTPFTLDFPKRRVYVPLGLTQEELTYIVAHEHTHLRRMDPLVKRVAYFALCLHWFNPLAWLAFFLMTQDMEMSCDEAVVRRMGTEEKRRYSYTLLSLSMRRSRLLSPSAVAFGQSGVKRRIRHALSYRHPMLVAVVGIVVAVSLLGVFLLANPALAEEAPVRAPVPPRQELNVYLPAGWEGNEAFCKLLDAYQNEYPEVSVRLDILGNPEYPENYGKSYAARIRAQLKLSSGPDLILVSPALFPEYEEMVAQGTFLDLSPLLRDRELSSADYVQPVMELGRYEGSQYLIPAGYRLPILVTTEKALNKAEFRRDTAGDFLSLSGEFARVGSRLMEEARYETVVTNLSPEKFVLYSGVELRGSGGEVLPREKQFAALCQTFKDYYQYVPDHCVPDDYETSFSLRHGVSTFSLRSSFSDFSRAARRFYLNRDEGVVMPLYNVDGGLTAYVSGAIGINANGKNQENARRFLELFLSKVGQYNFAQDTNSIRRDVTQNLAESLAALDQYNFSYTPGSIVPENDYQQDLLDYPALSDQISQCRFWSTQDMALFNEHMTPYFRGEKSYEECRDALAAALAG